MAKRKDKFHVGQLVQFVLQGHSTWARAHGEVGEIVGAKTAGEWPAVTLNGEFIHFEKGERYAVLWKQGYVRMQEEYLKPYCEGDGASSWAEVKKLCGWHPRKRVAKGRTKTPAKASSPVRFHSVSDGVPYRHSREHSEVMKRTWARRKARQQRA